MARNINLKNRFDIRFSSFLIGLLVVVFFALGFASGTHTDLVLNHLRISSSRIGNQSSSPPDPNLSVALIINLLLSPVLLIPSLKSINNRVNQEIEQEVKAKITELELDIKSDAKAEAERQIKEVEKQIKHEYVAGLKELQDKIREHTGSGKISEEAKIEIEKCFSHIRHASRNLIDERGVCDSISQWLENPKKLDQLLKYLCSERVYLALPDHLHNEFQANIKQCLLWLRYSLKDYSSKKVDVERCASAFRRGDIALEVYQEILNKITDFPGLKFKLRDSKSTVYLGEWITSLLLRIREEETA